MKYGKTHAASLSESAMDLMLNYGLVVPQAIAERSPAPLVGMYAYNKGEEATGSGKISSKVGRKLGNALRRSKGLPPIQNQQQESSSVRRAGLREASDDGSVTWETPRKPREPLKPLSDEAKRKTEEDFRKGTQYEAKPDAAKQSKPADRRSGVADVNSMRANIRGSGEFRTAREVPIIGKGAAREYETQQAGSRVAAANKEQYAEPDPSKYTKEGFATRKARATGSADTAGERYQQVMARKRSALHGKRISAGASEWAKNNLTKVEKPVWGSRAGSYGKGMLALGGVAAYKLAGAVTNAAQEVTRTASGGYADMIRGSSRMGESAAGLRENQATWQTRKTKYGPSGRKPWKFDFTKKSHVNKILKLGTDSDAKKMMKSNANITKHVGMQTKVGVPLKFAYASNDRKHLYAGKTIGMRQNILSQHKKLGIPLPKGFENSSFDQINELFKKRLGHGWYKRQYNKAPIHRKLMIGAASMWKGVKKSLGLDESSITELATFAESEAPVTPVACTFIEGAVATPMECDCVECLSVTRRAREGKVLTETAETSFGQNLRDGVQGVNELSGNAEIPKKISKKLMKASLKQRKQIGV